MSFLSNRAVNWLNAHAAVRKLSDSITELFSALYLYKMGLDLPQVLLAWGGIFALRLLFRPLTFAASLRLGLKNGTLLGMLLIAGQYVLLAQVTGLTAWLFAYIFYFAIAQSFYWTNYHAYFATLGDHAHRGKQLGVREAVGAVAGVIAPLVAGFTVAHFGFNALFVVATIFAFLGAAFLAALPAVPRATPISLRRAVKEVGLRGAQLYFFDAIQYYLHSFIWILVLFFLLKSNYAQFGGLVGLAVAFQAAGLLFFGHKVDGGAGKKLVLFGGALLIFTVLGRYFFGFTVPVIIGLDALLAVGYTLYLPAYHTCVYNSGKASANPTWFHFFGEIGWDLGSVVALGLGATLLTFGWELRDLLPLALFGQVALLTVVWRYYRK